MNRNASTGVTPLKSSEMAALTAIYPNTKTQHIIMIKSMDMRSLSLTHSQASLWLQTGGYYFGAIYYGHVLNAKRVFRAVAYDHMNIEHEFRRNSLLGTIPPGLLRVLKTMYGITSGVRELWRSVRTPNESPCTFMHINTYICCFYVPIETKQ